MTKKAILPKLFVAILLCGVLALIGCDGGADTSLTIDAYPPVNQTSDGTSPVMADIFKVRLGVFEQSQDTFNFVKQYKLDNIVKDYITCSTSKDNSGEWSEISCERCKDGGCNDADPTDLLIRKINNCKASGTRCEETEILDEERVDALELPSLPSGSEPFTYSLEGFGNLEIESTNFCDANNPCDPSWDCKTNESNLQVCVRVVDNAVVARGISAPTVYDGDNGKQIKMMFSLATKLGVLTTGNSKASQMNQSRTGHQSVALPDGKVLIFGGETVSGTSSIFQQSGELFDPETNEFKEITISGWSGGRSFFSLNEVASDETLEDTTEVKFVITGGKSTQGMYADIYLVTYNMETEALSFEILPSLSTPVANHTVTTLQDGKLLIVGGLSANGAVSDSYILDLEAKTLTPTTGQLTTARHSHTATLLSNGNVVIVGGVTNPNNFTTSQVEVYNPDTGLFSSYVYQDDEDDESDSVSRTGHIAIPLGDNDEDARVAIYGGYRMIETDQDNGSPYYYNTSDVNDVTVAFVDANGKVTTYSWTPNQGYRQAMAAGVYHPTVESTWSFLGDSKDTVLVAGGRSNSATDFSSWVEVIRFIKDADGYQFGSFRFGPDASVDIIATPFRSATMASGGRHGMSMTKLVNGNYLISGGSTYGTSGATQSISTCEVFVPPSHNTWGNVPDLMSKF